MARRNNNSRRPQPVKEIASGGIAVLEREPHTPTVIPIVLEARRGGMTPAKAGKTSRAISLAWDETEALGITADMRRSGPGMLSDQDRKEILYKAYLNSVWISACVDVIAKRVTSGGMVIELTENGVDNEAEKKTIHDFLHYINEDEDFLHLIRSLVTDLLIYGECYLEIVRKNGVPFSLHKVDCQTMNYKLDPHGAVLQYIQVLPHTNNNITFDPDDIIRFWLADPKMGKKALSPIERILGPTDADAKMADWVRSFFRKGARPNFWIEFLGSKEEADRFVAWLRENYTGMANAHVPFVLYDGAKLHEIGKGSVDMDFLKGREQMCKEIMAAYQVPPALVGLIESGNIGGGTGESQEKSFQFNACDPVRHLIFEKFNYRIVNKGFGITNYRVNTRYSDYRSDDVVSKVMDTRVRNGTLLVNEARVETGLKPVDGGDEAILVASRDIVAVSTFATLKDEHDQNTDLDLQTKKVQVDKLKNPPAPSPVVPGQPPVPGQPKPPANQKPAVKDDSKESSLDKSLTALVNLIDILQHIKETTDEQGPQQDSEVIPKHDRERGGQLSQLSADANRPTQDVDQSTLDPRTTKALEQWRERASEDVMESRIQRGFTTTDIPEPLHNEIANRLSVAWSVSQVDRIFSRVIEGKPAMQHWQDVDRETADTLKKLKEKGVKFLTWGTHFNACPECLLNHEKTVPLGEQFPSGAFIVPEHNHCKCNMKEEME